MESDTPKKKRGRPRKNPLPVAPAAEAAAPKRRGRPPKNKPVVEASSEAAPIKRKPGRPRKNPLPETIVAESPVSPVENGGSGEAPEKRKAGRPRKVRPDSEPVLMERPEGHRLAPPRTIYAELRGRFYAYGPLDWLRATEAAAKSGTFEVSGKGEKLPEGVTRYGNGPDSSYYHAIAPDTRVFSVERWDAEGFAYHVGIFRQFYIAP